MSRLSLLSLVEFHIRKEQLEKITSESNDRIGEQKLKLQRAQRDITDYSGRLKYGGKGGLNVSDMSELKAKEAASIAAEAAAQQQLDILEADGKAAQDDLNIVKHQIESTVNALKMRYCVTALNEKPNSARGGNAVRDEDGGGSKQPIAASFAENIHKIVDELKFLLVSGGKHPCLKLFINDVPPLNDAAPHYSSWEQRTLATIFNAKEKVMKSQQRLVDAVNACAAYYPDLTKNTALWTEFVELVDQAFIGTIAENINRALFMYERALGGKSAPELFSVNLKLTAACRVQVLPSAHELPNLLVSLIEEKVFTIVPSNTISDVVSAPTAGRSGKGVPLQKILADKNISEKLESIRNYVARYGEEIIAAVVKIEDQYQAFWNQEYCAQLSLEKLRAARDEVDFNFGAVRQRIFGGAFQLNAFPLQDTLSSLLLSQIDAKRQLEANTSDDVLQEMIKVSSLSGARTWAVPVGGLAALLKGTSSGSSPVKKTEEYSEKFDALKYVEQLVAAQLKSSIGHAHDIDSLSAARANRAPRNAVEPNVSSARGAAVAANAVPPLPLASSAQHSSVMKEKENIPLSKNSSPQTNSQQAMSSGGDASRIGTLSQRKVLDSPKSQQQQQQQSDPLPNNSSTSSGAMRLAGGAPLGPLVSPRPSSTPSSGLRTSISQQVQPLTQTPNRMTTRASQSPQDNSVTMSAIRSAELMKSNPPTQTVDSSSASNASRGGAWESPSAEAQPPKRDKPRTIDLPLPREPDQARIGAVLTSPYREKQAGSSPLPQQPRELRFEEQQQTSSGGRQLPQIHEERRPRSILKSGNPSGFGNGSTTELQSSIKNTVVSQPTTQQGGPASEKPAGQEDDDDDAYTLQRLLQKEKESLERIRQMKEKDDQRRREIQAAHRKTAVTDETMKKVSPRSEYQNLLEEQARLEAARKENEIKLREVEREARRARDEQESQRKRDAEEEDRQQREWEAQLRRQHEENAKRRTKEKQMADDAERDALLRKIEEEEKRKQYQKELEERLEEELRRRALQQQREREERDQERIRREHEVHLAQEAERQRQRAAFEKIRNSPPPRDSTPTTPTSSDVDNNAATYLPPVSEASALRRKLSLPPVQPLAVSESSRPATPPSLPIPTSARSRKPNTAPQGTPRGSIPPTVARSTTSFAQDTPAAGEFTPREQHENSMRSNGNSPLMERSLLDEYKQYCLNFGIKPNSGLLKSLPSVIGDYATTINLDLNYIGVKGVQPLLQILKKNRGLQTLNLKDNNLENNEVRALVNVLLTDSGNCLTHLDLSNNPISLAGGSAIMDLVTQKKSLTTVVLRGTLIQPKVVEKIVEAAEGNKRRAAWSSSDYS